MPRGRPAALPRTDLGFALRERRGTCSVVEAAEQIGISDQMYGRYERGSHPPRVASAEKIAEWLGAPWTAGAVIDAARRPAE